MLRGTVFAGTQRRDRAQQPFAVSQAGDTEVLQVFIGEFGQQIGINAVLFERRRKIRQSQLLKPAPDVHESF